MNVERITIHYAPTQSITFMHSILQENPPNVSIANTREQTVMVMAPK